ncbi:MAG: DUF4386 domain-containing protein [Proteobacteria bacterium]|nr:DUF4386 domain-containing protein [Pseudomonadota bacterium]
MKAQGTEPSGLVLARAAGILYLIVIVCAGFAEGFVRHVLVVPGDAAATAGKILANEGLFRFGFAADLVAFISDLVVAVLFYLLLKPVSRTLSIIAAFLRVLAHPAIASVNLLNHFAVLILLSGAGYLSVFNADQLNSLALLSLETHRYGYLIGGAFFGFHCLLLGYLLLKSDLFPGILGVLMVLASLGYLAESFGNFLFPGHEALLTLTVAVPAVIAEVSLCLWLVIRGVKRTG